MGNTSNLFIQDEKKNKIIILLILVVQAGTLTAQTNEKDVAAAADKHFKSANYTEALPLFAQLLSNNAAEVKYSYYYGVCRYMRGVNVADAIAHLEKAAAKNTTPPDVNYYRTLLPSYLSLYRGNKFLREVQKNCLTSTTSKF
ncbi:MAG: tetratricopeptide repeat protein [Bacteroidetes bacterium]|nr:tetratricopeptide repeat protein [Bacteroidota bacterium]